MKKHIDGIWRKIIYDYDDYSRAVAEEFERVVFFTQNKVFAILYFAVDSFSIKIRY